MLFIKIESNIKLCLLQRLLCFLIGHNSYACAASLALNSTFAKVPPSTKHEPKRQNTAIALKPPSDKKCTRWDDLRKPEKDALLHEFHNAHPRPSIEKSTGECDDTHQIVEEAMLVDATPASDRKGLDQNVRVLSSSSAPQQSRRRPKRRRQYPTLESERMQLDDTNRPNYPSKAELYKSCHMKTEIGRYWRTESTCQYCLFLTAKSGFLTQSEQKGVRSVGKTFDTMVESIARTKNVDFTPLRRPRLDYAEQTEIDPQRVLMLEACGVHYNLDFGLVVRYLGGEYTAEHRDVDALEREVGPHISPDDMAHMRRILTKGCPHTLDYEMKHKDKMKMIERGNQPTVQQNMEVVRETMNKEERNSHVVPFPIWMCTFSPFANHVSQGIVFKDGSDPRLVWDGTTKQDKDDVVSNDYVPTDDEPPITFGRTLRDFSTHLYNTRVSYPDQDIAIAAADIKACFRWPRLFPDFAAPFGFIITGLYYFISTAMVFGSKVSASCWEPFRRTIETMTEKYFPDKSLVDRYKEYIDMVTFEPPAPPDCTFVRAAPCALNPGVLDDNGNQLPIKAFVYVDDCLLAALRIYIVQLMCACIHAIFVVCGFPNTTVRQCPLAMNKWKALLVAHRAVLLGLQFDSRRLTMGITDDYRHKVLKQLEEEWPTQVRVFTLHKLVRLAGKLARLGEGAPWVFHLMPQVFASIAYVLRQNHDFLLDENGSFQRMIKQIKALRRTPTTAQDVGHLNFFLSKAAKKKFKCSRVYPIPATLRRELNLLRAWLADDSGIVWEIPLALIIKRMPSAKSWGDACLYGGGGFSLKLRFWWHLDWPRKIHRKTKAFLADDTNKDFVSINVLEFVTIIINFAAALTAFETDGHPEDPHPVLLNFADNMSSVRWTNHYCKGSMKARALGLLFCCLLANCFLGINAQWTPGDENEIADEISRTKNPFDVDNDGSHHRSFDYSQLLQKFPQLTPCRRFHPKPEFLSLLWQTILTGQLPDHQTILQMRRSGLGKLTT